MCIRDRLYAYEFQSAPDEAVLKIEKDLGSYPVFVKPANAGSSVGVSKAENREELRAAIAKAAKEDGKILIEENIVGQEVECAVLGNEDDPVSYTHLDVYKRQVFRRQSCHCKILRQNPLRQSGKRRHPALGFQG